MKSWQQNLIPQHLLSRLMGKLASAKLGSLTQFGIKKFIRHYRVNMDEAKITDTTQFETFNDFFTRELKTDARIISDEKNSLVSPVDGCVSEVGYLKEDQLLQAKGAYYSVRDLCGGDETLSSKFENGAFLTAYLSPKDYHRFHMPIAGKLKKMIYVPGKLFSVNTDSVKNVPGLFAKNERVICVFETEVGTIAYIAVGAMIVGSMFMNWHGVVAPSSQKRWCKRARIQTWDYSEHPIFLNQGDEVGHFRLGSTVIMLCEKNKIKWGELLCAEKKLQMGEIIARK